MRKARVLLVALLMAVAACSDDSSETIATEVGDVTVELRNGQLCLDGASKGGFCGERPTSEHPVAWGTASGGGPDGRTAVRGVATAEVVTFEVVVTGENPITPDLIEIEGGPFDGMNLWAIEVLLPGDPTAADAPQVTVENIETT